MSKASRLFSRQAVLVGGVIAAAGSAASAGYVFTLSNPIVSGPYDTYIASVQNDGFGGTGTNLLGVEADVTMTSAGYIHVDTTKDVGGYSDANGHFPVAADGMNDVDLPGINETFGSSAGTFVYLSSSTFSFIDGSGGVFDGNKYDWASNVSGGPNPHFNPSQYSALTDLDVTELVSNTATISDTSPVQFCNIVVPHGSTFVVTCNAGGTKGGPTLNSKLFPVVSVSGSALAVAGNAIASGTGGSVSAPQGTFSSSSNSLNVGAVSFVNNITPGTNAANVPLSGFTSGGSEVFLLDLKVSGAELSTSQKNTVIADLNANNTGLVASLVDPSLAALGGGANPWDIELTYTPTLTPGAGFAFGANSPSTPDGNFGFSFAGETNVPGVSVSNIASVPEPATGGIILCAGLGMLARRRSRKAARQD